MKRVWLVVAAVAASMLALAATASAALRWHAPQTVKTVRGIPEPQVAIDARGRAAIVYADSPPRGPKGVYVAFRQPGGAIGAPQYVGPGEEPQVAMAANGTTAIASRLWGRIDVVVMRSFATLYAPSTVHRSFGQLFGWRLAANPRVAIAADDTVTVAWQNLGDDGSEFGTQVRVATIAPDGAASAPQPVGPVAWCGELSLDANLAGDAVLSCKARRPVYVRAPGGVFQAADIPDLLPVAKREVVIDGAGAVTALFELDDLKSPRYQYLTTRSRGGAFQPLRILTDANPTAPMALFGQEARTVAIWVEGGRLGYAIRPSGGELSAGRRMAIALPGTPGAAVTAPVGPLPALSAGAAAPGGAGQRLTAVSVGTEGVPRLVGRPLIPGVLDFAPRIAASGGGSAVAVWEQACGEGYAVMAMALDERRGSSTPPCQDRRAPKAVVKPKRARLVGRAVHVRLGCDEDCRIGVRTRIVRAGGRGKPLVSAKTRKAQLLKARCFRTFRIGLSVAEAARVDAALAAGRRVTVRLALPVRDGYENGAVRRVAIPLRR